MIKIGIRNNLLYPSIFSITVVFIKIIMIVLREMFKKDFNCGFLLGFLKFIFEFIIGGLFSLVFSTNSKIKEITKEKGIKLIQNNNIINRPDGEKKILFLMILATFFEFIGTHDRRYVIRKFASKETQLMNVRLRSFEIITSSLLCYFLIKIRIYKHQIVALIIIVLSLTFGLILEFIYIDKEYVFKGLLVLFASTLTNSLRDIIEKYLLDVDYFDVFKLTAFEGLVDALICLPFYSFKSLRNEVYNLFHFKSNKSFCIIVYILIYAILCGFNSIYRKHTLIQYSPNTRAFAEAIWDPGFIIYTNFIRRPGKFTHSIIILILSIIIDFCTCIYNELLVLYCCGMEYETYLEVYKRGIISNDETDITEESISKSISKSISNEKEEEKEDKTLFE